MASLANLRESAAMRILVAIRTLIEYDAGVLRLPIRAIGVALCALHLRVHASQRITCFGMIELADAHRFPILEVVARLAIRSKPALMLVLVAGEACRCQA